MITVPSSVRRSSSEKSDHRLLRFVYHTAGYGPEGKSNGLVHRRIFLTNSTSRGDLTLKNKINYEQIIEIASYGILIAIVVFWNFFSNLFPIKLEQVISILIGLIAATNIAWTRKFNKMEKKIDPLKTSEMLVYPDLQSAFNAILSKKKRIKTLRTYSNSSNIIQTFIRPNNIIIDHCKVMFRNLPPQEEAENKRYALELENILQRWRNLEKAGQIKKLEASLFVDRIPSHF